MNSPPEIAKEYLEFAKKQVRLTLPKLIILSIYAGFSYHQEQYVH